MSAKICPRSDEPETAGLENCRHVVFLSCADFKHDNTGWRQHRPDPARKRTISIQPVCATIKSRWRIVHRHLRRQSGDLGRCNIGRIGQDQIERAIDTVCPVGADKPHPVGQPEGVRIPGSCFNRASGDIRTDPRRIGQLADHRQQQTARPRAKIENPCGTGKLLAILYRYLDNGFAVSTWFKCFRPEQEIQAPEFPRSDNPRNGFAGATPVNHGPEADLRIEIDRAMRLQQHIFAGKTESGRSQYSGIHHSVRDTGATQVL